MNRRSAMYGILAVAGLIGPWFFNLRYVTQGGSLFDIGAALRIAFGNPLSSSFATDLLIAFVTFAVWAWLEGRRIDLRHAWAYPILGLFIAFAFAFPLFLLVREQRLASRASS
jgi:hypothetical protein